MGKGIRERICTCGQKKLKNEKRQYYMAYTILFMIMCGFVYGYFFRNGKTFIYCSDGLKQHFKALIYYARWLRTILRNLWYEHKLIIPKFSFSIGYGSDIVTTLHYYAIGDPLNLFSAFVPTRYMEHFYSFLVLVRLYLAGVAFSGYCFYQKNSGRISVMAGAFSYIFCAFALTAAVKHPYFANPMIYFPLLLLGVEKIWKEKKPWTLIGSVFLSAISSFYFFYMLVIMVIVYVLVKVFIPYTKGGMKQALGRIFQIGGYSLIGVMLSACMLLPVLLLFFNNPRTDYSSTCAAFYPQRYYELFMAGFVGCESIGYWNFMGYTAPALLAVILLFLCKKKYKTLKAGFVLLTVFLLVPYVGFMMNGFSYVSNRWVWAYSMLVSYIITVVWDEMRNLSLKKQMVLIGIVAVYYKISFSFNPEIAGRGLKLSLLIMIPVFGILFLFHFFQKRNGKKVLEIGLLGLVVANLAGNAYFTYSPDRSLFLAQYLDRNRVDSVLNASEKRVMKAVNDIGEFYRYSGDIYNAANSNSTLLSGFSSVQFYWSLSNSTMAPFMEQLCLRDNSAYNYKTLDNRTVLNTLSSVKYYITKKKDDTIASYAPYGFSQYPIEGSLGEKFNVYKNDYELPLGYTYNTCISKEDYEELSPIEKQEALLQGILLEEMPEDYEAIEPELSSQKVDYTVTCEGDFVTKQGNSFVVTENNAEATLTFHGLQDSETCLYLDGLEYRGISPMSLYSEDESMDPLNLYTQETWEALTKEEQEAIERWDKYWTEPSEINISFASVNENGQKNQKKLSYRTPEFIWYAGRHNFVINLCYDEMAKNTIRITFPERGIYSFDSMEVICQPMKNYGDQVSALKENVLENVDLHNENAAFATNEVTGTISLNEKKILCLSVPYSSGWKAYVDGEEKKILQANTIFMALPLEKGNHEIRLVYHTPGMTAGIIVTCIGIFSLCVLILYKKRRNTEYYNAITGE